MLIFHISVLINFTMTTAIFMDQLPAFRLVNRPTTIELLFNLLKRSWYHKSREVINTVDFPGLIPFKRNLSTLIELAESKGTKVILMTQPNILKKI